MYTIRLVVESEVVASRTFTEAELRAARELLHRLAGGTTITERRALNMLRGLLASAPAQN